MDGIMIILDFSGFVNDDANIVTAIVERLPGPAYLFLKVNEFL